MSFVTLVRHGQANSKARDEDSYDRLSDLGHDQARWLGEWMRRDAERFARVYTGTLRRHIETADGIAPDCAADPVRDARLNELEYFTLATLLQDQHGIAIPTDRDGFVTHLPILFSHWQQNRITGAPESFEAFEARVAEVITEIAAGQGRALVVTSGGLIGMAMRIVMRLDLPALSHACLAIENSSLHRIQPLATGLAFTQFNAVPHLETGDKRHARSHI